MDQYDLDWGVSKEGVSKGHCFDFRQPSLVDRYSKDSTGSKGFEFCEQKWGYSPIGLVFEIKNNPNIERDHPKATLDGIDREGAMGHGIPPYFFCLVKNRWCVKHRCQGFNGGTAACRFFGARRFGARCLGARFIAIRYRVEVWTKFASATILERMDANGKTPLWQWAAE